MEIQAGILEKLRCSECKNYLSRAPIMAKTNGDSVCGRCCLTDEVKHLSVRMYAYEYLASMMTFPCRYKEDGCVIELPMEELEQHESYCKFHPLKCPLLPSESCSWLGPRATLLTHCQEIHSELVLEHPCTVTPSITRNCEMYMLTCVSQQLFLIQVKHSVATAKLWHCVRYLGNPEFGTNCEYNFEISSSKGTLTNKFKVMAQDNFQMHEDSSKEVDINAMLTLLGRYEDIKLSVKIECCLVTLASEDSELRTIFCDKVSNGCTFNDICSSNVKKHQVWLCKNGNVIHCPLRCSKQNSRSLLDHYLKEHSVDDKIFEKYFSVCEDNGRIKLYFGNNVFLCEWEISCSKLTFTVISDLLRTDNKMFNIDLHVTYSHTRFDVRTRLSVDHSSTEYDWIVIIEDTKIQYTNPPHRFYNMQLTIRT